MALATSILTRPQEEDSSEKLSLSPFKRVYISYHRPTDTFSILVPRFFQGNPGYLQIFSSLPIPSIFREVPDRRRFSYNKVTSRVTISEINEQVRTSHRSSSPVYSVHDATPTHKGNIAQVVLANPDMVSEDFCDERSADIHYPPSGSDEIWYQAKQILLISAQRYTSLIFGNE